MNVLFLSKWYPNKYDAMAGLFVRKHAQAAARVCDVTVMYVFTDPRIRVFEINDEYVDGVREITVLYPSSPISWLHSLSSLVNFIISYYKGFQYLFKQLKWRPDVIHVNVLTRHGVIAYLIKKLYRIPYVITEHWSRYLSENFDYKGIVKRRCTELVVRNAYCIMPVSQILADRMQQLGVKNNNYQVVTNVVDDYFFIKQPLREYPKKRILHISCFDDKAKNVCGILRSIESLSHRRSDFEVFIVGTGPDFSMVTHYADELHLNGLVNFIGEQTPQEVSDWFYQSNFFVFFSNYETAGVVLLESLTTGTPVITTPVGVAPMYINNTNGILVEIGNEQNLTDKMDFMLDHLQEFDSDIIRKDAPLCSYEAVGLQFKTIYEGAQLTAKVKSV